MNTSLTNLLKSSLLIVGFTIFSTSLFSADQLWTERKTASTSRMATFTSHHRGLSLNVEELKKVLITAPVEDLTKNFSAKNSNLILDIPSPDGKENLFSIVETRVMATGLAARYPEIKTYVGKGITNPGSSVRLDLTPAGFHAMVYDHNGYYLIDPETAGNITDYISFYKHDIILQKDFRCETETKMIDEAEQATERKSSSTPSGTNLRTYRLALACTGEYAATKGGTVPGALAGMVTSVNRVTGIYELEVAIRMELIENTDLLIFLNGTTDPYDNNDGGAMLSQNISTCSSIIGNANFDFGHVFSTGGGGVAFLGVPCGGSKAGGVTGLGSPVGDAFDVDYVAHEMGHQFGGNHTFNSNSGSCTGNRSTNSAYEPGSGSTIMGYAGICGTHDLQPNSDPYFHVRSFDEIVTYSTTGLGNNCPVTTPTGNNPPVVAPFTTTYIIPKSTPFTLTGSATDPNGDPLTYSWEQYTLGAAGAPGTPVGNAPRFRAFSPTTSPSRTFPKQSSLLGNTTAIGEVLSTAAQSLVFRFIVRDNQLLGGGVDYQSANLTVNGTAGPFTITVPNTNVVWTGGSDRTVTWNIAGTNIAPINTTNVDILLSTDGGITFPITLLSNVPNDGSDTVTLPLVRTLAARIKIVPVGNIYFDISNVNFQIQSPDFDFTTLTSTYTTCAPDTTDYTLNLTQFFGFNELVTFSAVGLPAGVSVLFNNPTLTPPATLVASIISDQSAQTGVYTFFVKGTSLSVTDSVQLTLRLSNGLPAQVLLANPLNNAINVSRTPTLTANAVAGNVTYKIEIATDSLFTTIVRTASNLAQPSYLVSPALTNLTTYFWRMSASNACGLGLNSTVQKFTTIIAAPAAPTFLTGTVTSSSEIVIGWTDNSTTELGFILERSPINAGSYSILDTIATGILTYQDQGLLPNTKYFYRIKSYNLGGNSANSTSINRTTFPLAPIAPTNLIASAPQVKAAQLNWSDNSNNETGFKIERSLNELVGFVAIDTVNANIKTFLDPNLLENTIYYYQVSAINLGGVTPSNIDSVLTTGSSIAAPSNLIATGISNTSINITWTDNSSNEDFFSIERATGLGANFTVLNSITNGSNTYLDENLTPLTTYSYRVVAKNNTIGRSLYSNSDSAITNNGVGIFTLIKSNNLTTYPNPFSTELIVNLKESKSGKYSINVLDVLGKIVYESVFIKSESDYLNIINLADAAKGVYILTVINEDGNISKAKLIKE